ncbi:hypothetical protein KY284_013130 [Solanum tuberosum]|nr:hypothetical protein KY284_013130 [Solanum tuberosum]
MKLKFQYTNVHSTWPQMVALLDAFRPRFVYKWVKWHPPPSGWLKCNTDGASRGNPRPSVVAFCIINHEGELVIAKGVRILDSTNLVAEAITIRERRVGNTLECDYGGTYELRSLQEVPDIAKRIIILDKQSTPQLRIRQSNTTRV